MKFLHVAVLVGLVLLAAAKDLSYDGSENVVVLTDENFHEHIKNVNGFVEFYAPWCGHCQHLKPIWEAAADNAPEGVAFAAIDADKYSTIGHEFEVQGFPTIMYFKNGNKFNYEGERSQEAFYSFADKLNQPPFTVADAEGDVEKITAANDIVVVGTFTDAESDEAKAFKEAAEALFLEYKFALRTGEENGLVVYKKGEDNEVFDGEMTKDSLVDFVKTRAVPLVDELNQNSFQARVMPSTVGNFILFVDPAKKESNEPALAALRAVAKKSVGEGNFFWIDGIEFSDFAQNVDLNSDAFPGLIVLDIQKQAHFVFNGTELSEEAISEFAANFKAGLLTRDLKSEEIPTEDDGDVKVLVGKNFEEVALDTTKDVLVEFYAPWCGHCKRLAPTWQKIAKYLKPVESLVVAKIDMDANELPSDFAVQGFPTIRLFPAGEDALPVEHDGGRSFKDIVKFVKKNAKIDFELPKKEKKESEEKNEGKDEL